MNKYIFVICFACLSFSCSCMRQVQLSPHHDRLARSVLSQLQRSVDNKNILFGHHNDLITGYAWKFDQDDPSYPASDIKYVAADYPAIFGVDLGAIERIGFSYQRGNTFGHMVGAIKAHYNRGGIVTVSAHMDNLITKGNAWDVDGGNIVEKIINDDATRNIFYSVLDEYASFFKQLRTDNGDLIPVLFRPWHESNLDCFWWGGDNCSNSEYKTLWRITFERLAEYHNLQNLIWVYSPSNIQDSFSFYKRYPGDKYVDVIGYEAYEYWNSSLTADENNESFIRKAQRGLCLTCSIAKKHNKVAAFTETGLAGDVYSNWWTECLGKVIENSTIAYVYIWDNQFQNRSKSYAPFQGSLDSADFVKFINNTRCSLLNSLENVEK